MLHGNNVNRISRSDYSHTIRAQRVPQPVRKISRTYGWDCPFDNYKSNKHYNTQRHINLIHGYGSGEPIDSLTGLTREQKRRNALGQGHFFRNTQDNSYNTNSSYRPSNYAQLGYGSDSSQSYVSNQNSFDTPLLNDATKRVKELGYYRNGPAGIQMTNTTPHAAYATGRARSYTIRPNFQPQQGIVPGKTPNPNPIPNPYNPPTVPQNQYAPPNDLSQIIPDAPQNAVLRRNQALYNLMKEP